ncbi:ATP-binding protein [Laspinema palackyanum]|uniref:ATP-binding protein n=1 Tax=Laspinema palackyanum TaxID=3231601 RepID=UPI00345DB23E|nr:AAA family ATPase [Laspinema sp. D2c]
MKNFFSEAYQITETLYESGNSLIYRVLRQTDGQSVILKLLQDTYPSPERIAQFKREYELTHNLHHPGIIDAYHIETLNNRWCISLEDFGGQNLHQLNLAPLSPTDFLPLAIEIVEILGYLHQNHIIHKDINPSNILFNPTTQTIKLIDFGLSTVLSQEISTFRNPNLLEGTLAYISPEQTGRMNRSVDYRTDFYSLGITFYELLTGSLPFLAQDPLELVHSHLAKPPTPPYQINSKIPQALSQIILKLVAKNAEDRYKSASGLKADLQQCWDSLQRKGKIALFPLGIQDISERLQIPQKLYGREQEVATLIEAFKSVTSPPDDPEFNSTKITLVSGYSGIGKTALVQEIYKPITRGKGYFIAGKFDQFHRNIPYASLIQAFRSLIKQFLTETDSQIAQWREKLQKALGVNAPVIIEVIPELATILGTQSPIPELSPVEAQNRFNLAFQNFIKVFTQPEHPLAIFLDDLQWADSASLQLIELIMTAPESQCLFLIGAYRDNEVSATHPLMLTVEAIKKTQARVLEISLKPLALSDVTQLLADTLYQRPQQVQPLAELVESKTGGNPFFLTEFLKTLYGEGWLRFDYNGRIWQWNIQQIQGQPIADNVVDLMAAKLHKLPPETQTILELAACIGNQFDLTTLAIIAETSARETALTLKPALNEGFILPLSDDYNLRFAHF